MFYTFVQNNSGGKFHFNEADGITHYVIISAKDANEANRKAEDIGIYFWGCDDGRDCSCCGDRWSCVDKDDGTKSPQIYGKSPKESFKHKWQRRWMASGKEICVHYMNGNKVWY